MKTTKIFKSEVNNSNIWKLMLIDLELPHNTDEITIEAIAHETESQEKGNYNGN
jgi:hypothetical protein